MPTIISGLGWTPNSDSFGKTDFNGPLQQGPGTASFLAGNDSLYGSFSADAGVWIYNGGIVDAGKGSDTIRGISEDNFGIFLDGTDADVSLLLGDGNDVVLGESSNAIGLIADEGATINGGAGNDYISGFSGEDDGVYLDDATVDLGAGNDTFGGASLLSNGVYAEDEVSIYGGAGNDVIGGSTLRGEIGFYLGEESLIDAGTGGDEILGEGSNYGLLGEFGATIHGGTGNDEIIGSSNNLGLFGFPFFFGEDTEEQYGRGISIRDNSELYGDAGNDCVEGSATVYSVGDQCLADAVGVEVTSGSLADLGAGNDAVTGDAYADTETTFDGFPWAVAATTNATGVEVSFDSTLVGGAGNDAITANAVALGEDSTAIGVYVGNEELGNGSEMNLGAGNDQIVATATATNTAEEGAGTAEATGVLVEYSSSIDLGVGNDSIRSTATATNDAADAAATATGVYVGEESSILGGAGRNSVQGTATADSDEAVYAYGIQVGDTSSLDNSSKIDLGGGNDSVIGTATAVTAGGEGEAVGLWVNGAQVLTGAGNDLVRGVSSDSGAAGVLSVGIKNAIDDSGTNNDYGKIVLGDGNDTLTGSGSDIGIWNDGSVDTGSGNDVVDASTGGFYTEQSTSVFKLGLGNDLVKGYGTGTFDGEGGTDTIRLFGTAGGVTYTFNAGLLTGGTGAETTSFNLSNFELVGAYGGTTIALVDGDSFTVYLNSITT